MGAINSFAPLGIFCEGGAFFSPPRAGQTVATIKSTKTLTTLILRDIVTPPNLPAARSCPLIKHNLLDVFGARLARALPAAYRVCLVHGVPENNCTRFYVGNLNAGFFV